MKRNINFSLIFFLSLLMFIFVTFPVDARKTNMKKKLHKHHKESHPHSTQVNTYDIMSFGANGNGVSDDSQVIKMIFQPLQ